MNITQRILLVAFAFCSLQAIAQPGLENRISVSGEGSIDVPVDQVIFTIQLQSTDSSSISKVYEKQKALEKKVVKLLKDLKIADKNISYSLFSIGRTRDYEAKVWYYLGQQTLTFKLDSIALYSDIQKRLITEGFSEFGSSFSVKNIEPQEDKALQKAVAEAKKKAALLATAADRKIKRIVTVIEGATPRPMYEAANLRAMKSSADSGGSLTEFSQTIPVHAEVTVVFELE